MLESSWMKRVVLLWNLLYSMKDVPHGYIVLLGYGSVIYEEGTERLQADKCYDPVASGKKRANILVGQNGKLKLVAFDATWSGLKKAYQLACAKEWRRSFGWQVAYIPRHKKF